MSSAQDYREKAAVWRARADTSMGEARERCLQLAESYLSLDRTMESRLDPANAEALARALAASAKTLPNPLNG